MGRAASNNRYALVSLMGCPFWLGCGGGAQAYELLLPALEWVYRLPYAAERARRGHQRRQDQDRSLRDSL
jgi:hypothetical protein